jgi:hypothetical protein
VARNAAQEEQVGQHVDDVDRLQSAQLLSCDRVNQVFVIDELRCPLREQK